MTEAEWLACTDPRPMLEFLRDKASERKLRLFACACCRHLDPILSTSNAARSAVALAEQYVDGIGSQDAVEAASRAAAEEEYRPWNENARDPGAVPREQVRASWVARIARWASSTRRKGSAMLAAEAPNSRQFIARVIPEQGWPERLTYLLREVVGNPFRVLLIDRACLAWKESTIPKLAHGIYADRAFDHLPILADALEDAGCDNADILAHCRGPGPHVRGCWVVDLLLGKS